MKTMTVALCCAFVTLIAAQTWAQKTSAQAVSAHERRPACASIMRICMKRAGAGHANICEDMFSQAKNSGVWPATQDEEGRHHAAVPCER
ncbi:MAG: hypothetical protein KGL46_08435 [Hyphomicrobiales bacterium]|nr:hypothetical protein [Hyphomicrobiales bacterium]